jgi:hypothetical protein
MKVAARLTRDERERKKRGDGVEVKTRVKASWDVVNSGERAHN